MNKYSIRQMIDSGSWFACESEGMLGPRRQFRIRFHSFRHVDIAEIDKPQNIRGFAPGEGRLWLLSFSAVNLGKEGFKPYEVQYSFVIVDHDECEFQQASDTYLSCVSDFSLRTGLRRFSGTAPFLAPKMVADGAAVYLLPDEDSPQYFLKMKKTGTIEEM